MRSLILKLARKTIENHVKNGVRINIPDDLPEEFKNKKGVFVTIYKNNKLRGCIGLPYPKKSLIENLIEASISVCSDPRFPNLKQEELEEISIEVSVLTDPELVKVSNPEEYKKNIEIGKHGLIIRRGLIGGLFLPKVPLEQNWNIKEYLENLCYKAD